MSNVDKKNKILDKIQELSESFSSRTKRDLKAIGTQLAESTTSFSPSSKNKKTEILEQIESLSREMDEIKKNKFSSLNLTSSNLNRSFDLNLTLTSPTKHHSSPLRKNKYDSKFHGEHSKSPPKVKYSCIFIFQNTNNLIILFKI